MTRRAVVVLPQPASPTIPSVPPRITANVTQAAADILLEQAGDVMAGLVAELFQRRIDARMVGLRVRAARMEVAARRAVDEARRRARDLHELLVARALERRDRPQQSPRVGVF